MYELILHRIILLSCKRIYGCKTYLIHDVTSFLYDNASHREHKQILKVSDKAVVTTTIRLQFDWDSTALRPFETYITPGLGCCTAT